MSRRSAAGLLALGIAGSVLPLAGVATPQVLPSAYAADPVICAETTVPTTEALAGEPSKLSEPLERMHVPQAQQITRGRGARVVVIDSGIQPGLGINQGPALSLPELSPVLLSGHGTIVGALIAGPKGVAPEAEVIDVRVFDSAEPDLAEGQKPVTSQGIAAGVEQAIALHRTTRIDIVNIALSVGTDDPELRQAIKDLQRLDVIVVASAGNADQADQADQADEAGEDETFAGTPDNDKVVFPADYRGVLAVSAAPPPGESPIGRVAPNLDTDVAAPTVGGISINANGVQCDIEEVATSWATAEVSGVLALLRSAYPKETAKQTIARLLATTEGSEAARNPWTGAGIVQAHDALTRSLDPGRSGRIVRSVRQDRSDATAPLPPPRLDLFGSSRALLLWFGLGGGALMALAFMLRSLTRR